MLNETAMEIYHFIKESIETEYPPTVREICSALNIKSTSTVHKYINILVEEGYIEKLSKHNRTIRLKRSEGSVTVPIVGRVAAGYPITAIENITDYINFSTGRRYDRPLFGLKVKGESMINVGIFDGDIIIVEQTQYAENGEIVVALVGGEDATVKTFYKEDGHFRLQPENDTMEPIIVDEVEILGKVIALMRYF